MKKLLGLIALTIFSICALVGCGNGSGTDKTVLKIGATSVPHAEILEHIKPKLEKEGVTLDIVEFSDYVQPNMALNDKQLDANFFQHKPYLDEFMKEHNLKLVSVGNVHVEPMGVYSQKVKSIADIPENATIAIPNDPTNGGRALILLAHAGLIELKDPTDITSTVQDVVKNPKNISFKEVEAAQLPRVLPDVTAAVINTNYAMQADLVPARDALTIEDSSSPYANIVVIRPDEENNPAIKKLMDALRSDDVKEFLEEKYKGAVVPAFGDK